MNAMGEPAAKAELAANDQPDKVVEMAENGGSGEDGHKAEPKKDFVPSEGLTTHGAR